MLIFSKKAIKIIGLNRLKPMKYKFKLSVSIPVYNGAKNLKKQFDRIFKDCDNNKFNNFLEIVISDNFSTDNTKKVVSRYKKKSLKKKNLSIKYFKNKKNYGYKKNFIKLSKLVKGEYVLFLSDDDVPGKDFYMKIYNEIIHTSKVKMLILPIHNSNKYYHAFFGFNKVSYIVNRGGPLSGFILNTKKINYQSYLNTLYPHVELYLSYFLKYGAEDLHVKSVIKNIDVVSETKHKFNDRMQRGKDFAFFDRIKILEKFYRNKKINFIEFYYAIYSTYKRGLAITLKLNNENEPEYESIFLNEIIKYKRKNLLKFMILLIFLRKSFSKDRNFYYNAFIKTLYN